MAQWAIMGNTYLLSIDAPVKYPVGVYAAEFHRAPIAGSSSSNGDVYDFMHFLALYSEWGTWLPYDFTEDSPTISHPCQAVFSLSLYTC